MRTAIFILCTAVLSASCTSPLSAPPASSEADTALTAARAAVDAAWREHIDAASRKDAAVVTRIYADDIVYLIPGSPDVRGRAAIDKMETDGLASADVLDVSHTTHDLRLFGDTAYELGTVEGPVQPKGQSPRTVTYHFMAMWQRQPDGAWRIRYLVGQ